jgi:hypothetical protein
MEWFPAMVEMQWQGLACADEPQATCASAGRLNPSMATTRRFGYNARKSRN